MAGTGYRVGARCFADKADAQDFVLSQVVPAIRSDGTMSHPVKHGAVWQYGGQPVVLTFPECDPMADFDDGLTVAAYVVGMMFVAFVFRVAIGMFKQGAAGDYQDGE